MNVFAYQIYYNESTKAQLQPEFLPLDNTENRRPDWAEYWPIRNFFENKNLDPNDWYGFFSPSFAQKTGLTSSQVMQFINLHKDDCDAILFSPFWPATAFYKNPFEQAEHSHHLIWIAKNFFEITNSNVDVENFITHSENTVYCNYFVAKSRFWERWNKVTNILFEFAENPKSALYRELNQIAKYANGQYGNKVFIMERIATTILAYENFKIRSYDTFSLPGHLSSLNNYREQLITCDALKQLYVSTNNDKYLYAFISQRDWICHQMLKTQKRAARK